MGQILYHYCSTNNFISILSNRSLWLSSLNLSNDSMEGKLVGEMIERFARNDGFDESAISYLQTYLRVFDKDIDGLGFCLSEDGDLLSQWRGYAADATGLSIGFSKEYLNSLKEWITSQKKPVFSLAEVRYKQTAQEELVRPIYDEIKSFFQSDRHRLPHPPTLLGQKTESEFEREMADFKDNHFIFYLTTLKLLPDLYSLKTYAFREELEWRMIIYHSIHPNDSMCLFKALHDRIVPYMPFYLTELSLEPVCEVIIGPKNLTPVHVIEGFLEKYGFLNVRVYRSSATYR
jgi:hypothetical protein